MREGTRVHNPPADVVAEHDRYWQLETSYPGGWPAARAPRLRLGWHAHELLFVPKGEPPFTLAFGRTGAENAAAPIEALLAGLGTPETLARPEPATLGPKRDLAGADALAAPRPIRRIVLWAVLVAAVLALAALVVRAARDMKGASRSRDRILQEGCRPVHLGLPTAVPPPAPARAPPSADDWAA